MDRAELQRHFEQARAIAEQGAHHVENQRTILANLERDGDKASVQLARDLLLTFEDGLRLHVEDRDRLKRMIKEADGAASE